MNNSLLTVKDVADRLKISTSTVYRVCKRGLPHIHKTFGIRIQVKALDEWIDQGKSIHVLTQNILRNVLTNMPPIGIDKAKGGIEVARKKTRHNYGYGAIYLRKTKKGIPRYYIDYYDNSGKRIQALIKHATNWNEAHEALKDAVLTEHYNDCGIKEQKRIRFGKFVEMFVENYSRVNKRSWKDDFYRLRKCSDFFGNVNLDEISPLDIERFKSSRLKERVSRSTVNRHLAILKTLYNVASEWGYAGQNPVKGVKFFSEKDTLRQRILTADEEDRLLEAASKHLKPILLIALNTGARRGEVLNLEWSHIDFDTREIRLEETKSGKPRIVDINSRLFDVLTELKNKGQNNSYLFVNPKTGKSYKKLQTSFDGACRRAGIEGLRFHDLRHTFASRLVESGVDLIRVKEILGHSTVKITERYTHSNREERKKAVELLCQKPSQRDQKRYNLLHIRYTENRRKKSVPVIPFISMN